MDATAPRGPTALNLGCGRKRRPDAVNVDRTPRTGPDVLHDLDVRPWPFPDNHFQRVYAFDVIEHLENVVAAMEELHRVCCDEATVEITVPHFSSANAFADPTHRHFFSRFTFDFFDGAHELAFYTTARFRVVRSNLIFTRSPVNRVVGRLANHYPRQYEARWAWLFPAWFISVELKAVKAGSSAQAGSSA